MRSQVEEYKCKQRLYIRKYLFEHKTTQVEFVDGYSDPMFVGRKIGCGYRGSSKIRVGKLFLLGKIY